MAIITSDPATRDQLAYARLIITEALCHGGAGWLDYDRAFCQQAAADPSLRWNTLIPGLHQPCWASDPPKGQRSVLCAERLITLGPSVHFFAYIHQWLDPQPPRPPLPGANLTFVSHGTGACAFSQATVYIGMSVPPVISHTRLRIAQRPLIA